MVLRESGKYKDALDHIEKNESYIVDKLAVVSIKGRFEPLRLSMRLEKNISLFLKAEMNYKIGEISRAEALYNDLIDRNPDNLEYYQKLELCKNMSKYICSRKIFAF